MSVEEIVKYVRQTPGNTNPSVVSSMVNAEMNSTLEEAKKYTDSKQLARTEKKVYTFDGNVDGKENILGLVKISDDEPDLKQAVSVEITTPETAEGIITLTKDMFSVAVSDGTNGFVKGIQSIILDDIHLVVCIPNEGLYFAYYEDPVGIIYTSKIVFETVHQIDPKFIPNSIIDLSKIECGFYGNAQLSNFSSVVLETAMALILSGGGVAITTVRDIDHKLRRACTDAQNSKMRVQVSNGYVDAPIVYIGFEEGVGQISVSFLCYEEIYFEVGVNTLFYYGDTDQVDILVKVTVLNPTIINPSSVTDTEV